MVTDEALAELQLEKQEDDGESVRIFRVPHYIKAKSPSEFVPQEVFVGLYVHTQLLTKTGPMHTDHSKLAIARIICRGSWKSSPPPSCPPAVVPTRWKDLMTKLEPQLRVARTKYDSLNLDEEAEKRADYLLALDASFIVAFLRYSYAWADCWGYSFGTELNRSRFVAQKFPVLRDLLLLENQVPMSLLLGVIEYFLTEQNSPKCVPDSESELYELLAWFVVQVYPFNHGVKLDCGNDALEEYFRQHHKEGFDTFQNCEHLLECAYLGFCGPERYKPDVKPVPCGKFLPTFCSTPVNPEQAGGRNRFRIPSATSLRRVGISVKVRENSLTMDSISFVRRKLKYMLLVPKLIMNDNTAAILRNLALFEQIRDDGVINTRGDMRTYLFLMSSLIDNVNDVRLLMNKGVIVNQLGSADAVCKQWNDMCDGLYIPPTPAPYWYQVQERICQLEKSKSHKWFAEIEDKNFSSCFVLGSFIAITLVFASTMIQAIFTVLSYFVS